MLYPIPYNSTIKKILEVYNNNYLQFNSKQLQYSNNQINKKYLLSRTFKELLVLLHVDIEEQREEIRKYFNRYNLTLQKDFKIEDLPDRFLQRELTVLIGSLYEQDIASLLQAYQLTPDFSNTYGHYVNMTNGKKMKNMDIIVRSLKDNSLHAFDIKHGSIWQKSLLTNNGIIQKSPLYAYNSGLEVSKYNEIYSRFKLQLEQQYHQKVYPYVLFVCYDFLNMAAFYYNNHLVQLSDYYRLAFNNEPNHLEKCCFVVDLEQIFIQEPSFNDKVFDRNSPYVLHLQSQVTAKDKFANQYAIRLDSPACMNLHDFIMTTLINN